jgi:hypothetical protein
MKNLHEQKISQKPYGRNFMCLGIYCVNDGSKVDVNVPQLMHYVIFYNNLMSSKIFNQRTRLKKV